MKKILQRIANSLGYTIQKKGEVNPDITEEEFWEIYGLAQPYTMTSVERMYGLYLSVLYILSNGIQGSFVECGVWRGGSSLLIAKMLANRGITDRKLYLYDTYEGMSDPTKDDVAFTGRDASTLLEENKANKEESVWCLADLADVKKNLRLAGYPEENIFYIKGKVEDTIPTYMPEENLALLRLDTDWYESTKHELRFLFPKLVQNGILLIDDYGHWQGCRKATDEFFSERSAPIFLNRIDYTARVAVKTSPVS